MGKCLHASVRSWDGEHGEHDQHQQVTVDIVCLLLFSRQHGCRLLSAGAVLLRNEILFIICWSHLESQISVCWYRFRLSSVFPTVCHCEEHKCSIFFLISDAPVKHSWQEVLYPTPFEMCSQRRRGVYWMTGRLTCCSCSSRPAYLPEWETPQGSGCSTDQYCHREMKSFSADRCSDSILNTWVNELILSGCLKTNMRTRKWRSVGGLL